MCQPVHEILVLIAHAQSGSLNMHAQLCSGATPMVSGQSHCVHVNIESVVETVQMHRLV